jgi:hypothetical protein
LNEEMRMAQWLGDNICRISQIGRREGTRLQEVRRRYMAEVKAEEVKAKS